MRRAERSSPPIYAGRSDLLVKSRICLTPAERRAERDAPVINTPLAAAQLCRHLTDNDQETKVVIALSTKGRVLAIFEAAIGGTRSVAVGMQHALKVPILVGAHKVVLIHNHPSGDPTPSAADRDYYAKAKAAFALVGPRLVDSLVVAHDGFFSFAANAKGSWDRPPASLRRELYRQAPDFQGRRDNPGPRGATVLDVYEVARSASAGDVPEERLATAAADVLEMTIEDARRAGRGPSDVYDATVAMVRRMAAADWAEGEDEYRDEVIAALDEDARMAATPFTRTVVRTPRSVFLADAARRAISLAVSWLGHRRGAAYTSVINFLTSAIGSMHEPEDEAGEREARSRVLARFVESIEPHEAGRVAGDGVAPSDPDVSLLVRVGAMGNLGLRLSHLRPASVEVLRREGLISVRGGWVRITAAGRLGLAMRRTGGPG